MVKIIPLIDTSINGIFVGANKNCIWSKEIEFLSLWSFNRDNPSSSQNVELWSSKRKW
jgi:hypothetical protein